MYIYIYIYIYVLYVYIYMYRYVYLFLHISLSLSLYVCAYIYIYIYIYVLCVIILVTRCLRVNYIRSHLQLLRVNTYIIMYILKNHIPELPICISVYYYHCYNILASACVNYTQRTPGW